MKIGCGLEGVLGGHGERRGEVTQMDIVIPPSLTPSLAAPLPSYQQKQKP